MTKRCAVCGEEFEPITLGEYANGIGATFEHTSLNPSDKMEVCMEHAAFLYTKCFNCGSLIPAVSQVVAHTFMRSSVFNYSNNELSPSNEMMVPLCAHCADPDEHIAVVCEECNRLFILNDSIAGSNETTIVTSHNGSRHGYLCNGCAENYRPCRVCGALTHISRGSIDEDADGVITCSQCMESRRVQRRNSCSPTSVGINGYCYKPDPIFYHSDGETFESIKHKLYGVEIEVDTNKSYDEDYLCSEVVIPVSEVVSNFVKKVYVKTDGSLSSRGLEFVSMPMSLKYHKDNLGWDKVMKKLVSFGYRGHNIEGCGLHVHINKAAFLSDEGMADRYAEQAKEKEDLAVSCSHNYHKSTFSDKHIAELDENVTKFVFLFEHFWDLMLKFSRRSPSRLSYCERYGTPNSGVNMKAMKDLVSEDGSRYRSVNVTTSYTVEVRLFRSTLNFNTFIASIQLCDVLIDLARSKSISELAAMTVEDLAKFIYGYNYTELTTVFDKVTKGVYSTDTSDADPNGVEVCEEVDEYSSYDSDDNDSYEDDEE